MWNGFALPWGGNFYLFYPSLNNVFVKLRERVREGLGKGKSPKGHLSNIDY